MRVAIIHTVRSFQGNHHTIRLIINNVPEKTNHVTIAELLTEKGKAGEFTEAGVPWGNHQFKNESAKTGFGKDVPNDGTAPEIEWDDLNNSKPEIKRVTLRLEKPMYDAAVAAAARENLSLQGWWVKITNEASGFTS